MRKLPSWLSATIIAVVAIAAVYYLGVSTTPSEERGIGKEAPAITGTLVDGKPFRLSDYRGKVVLINFWGTWCAPCRAEIPDLIKIQDKYKDRGFTIVGLADKQSPAQSDSSYRDELNLFISKTGMNYPNLPIPDGTKTDYGIEAFPSTLLIDKNGKAAFAWVGPVDIATAQEKIESLLK